MYLFRDFVQVGLSSEVGFDELNCLGNSLVVDLLLLVHGSEFISQMSEPGRSQEIRNLLNVGPAIRAGKRSRDKGGAF